MNSISELWYSHDEQAWTHALARYWDYVQLANQALERELENLDVDSLKHLDARGWYEFLHDKYFAWKYTQKNYYVTTTRRLQWYIDKE